MTPPIAQARRLRSLKKWGLSLWLLVSLGHPVTLESLSPLALSAILGIEFPCSLHLADF